MKPLSNVVLEELALLFSGIQRCLMKTHPLTFDSPVKWVETVWVLESTLLLITVRDTLLNLSEPQRPHLKQGEINSGFQSCREGQMRGCMSPHMKLWWGQNIVSLLFLLVVAPFIFPAVLEPAHEPTACIPSQLCSSISHETDQSCVFVSLPDSELLNIYQDTTAFSIHPRCTYR